MLKILAHLAVLALATLTVQTVAAMPLIYPIQGQHSSFGGYQGRLEIRPRGDGRVDVIRQITYDTYQFENFRVEQVWSGQGTLDQGTLNAQFELKSADVFKRVDQKIRQPDDFSRRLTVTYSLDLNGGGSNLLNTASGTESDIVTGTAQPAGEQPLWQNQRVAIPTRGESFRALGDFAFATVFKKLTEQLRALPFVQTYHGREEYESRNQYFISDKTDFEFLRAHSAFLRITNKSVDEISLFESALRAHAYGPTLDQKQTQFENNILAGINEVGLLERPVFDETGRRTGSITQYDGALWSGMYAGALAMRWKLTQDPEALATFRRVLSGVLLLMDVTGDPATFARTITPIQPGEAMPEKWQQAAPPYQHLRFLQWGNNDMMQGLLYAMAWGYEILPEGDPLLTSLNEHAVRLKDLDVTTKKWYGSNIVRASGLHALATGRTVDVLKFLAYYDLLDRTKNMLGVDDGFFYEGIADWSGINLITVSTLTNILVAKNLQRRTPGFQRALKRIVRETRQNLVDTAATFAPARRDSLTLAADAFSVQDSPALDFAYGLKPKRFAHQEEWAVQRENSKWSLREIPALTKPHDTEFDRSMDPNWCVSAWPSLPWKYLGGEKDMGRYIQGAYSYPLFERQFNETDNVFAGSPFTYRGSERKEVSALRMDFLHAYWLGRISGAIGPND